MVLSCSILEWHCGINGRHFSLPYPFIREICFVRRPTAGSQGEAGELRMICVVTGGQRYVLTDGQRYLILTEGALQWNEQRQYKILRATLMPTNSASSSSIVS